MNYEPEAPASLVFIYHVACSRSAFSIFVVLATGMAVIVNTAQS